MGNNKERIKVPIVQTLHKVLSQNGLAYAMPDDLEARGGSGRQDTREKRLILFLFLFLLFLCLDWSFPVFFSPGGAPKAVSQAHFQRQRLLLRD